jgi:hypothetical protein
VIAEELPQGNRGFTSRPPEQRKSMEMRAADLSQPRQAVSVQPLGDDPLSDSAHGTPGNTELERLSSFFREP